MSRARVLFPPYASELISFDHALAQPLAEEFGTQIDGIASSDQLYEVFRAQGSFLLQSLEQPADDPSALRQLSVPHGREQELTDNLDNRNPISLRVLYPFAPPYGYLQKTEQGAQGPLRMTFGIARPTEEGTDAYRVGRTTLWVTEDTMSLQGTFRVLKDTITKGGAVSADGVEKYFTSNTRSRSRSSFTIDRLLND